MAGVLEIADELDRAHHDCCGCVMLWPLEEGAEALRRMREALAPFAVAFMEARRAGVMAGLNVAAVVALAKHNTNYADFARAWAAFEQAGPGNPETSPQNDTPSLSRPETPRQAGGGE